MPRSGLGGVFLNTGCLALATPGAGFLNGGTVAFFVVAVFLVVVVTLGAVFGADVVTFAVVVVTFAVAFVSLAAVVVTFASVVVSFGVVFAAVVEFNCLPSPPRCPKISDLALGLQDLISEGTKNVHL